jgi:hypothetical protein
VMAPEHPAPMHTTLRSRRGRYIGKIA